jgi:hypothetical protein
LANGIGAKDRVFGSDRTRLGSWIKPTLSFRISISKTPSK